MGGNLVKDCRRISKEEYPTLCEEVLNLLPFGACIPPSYRNKDSFGDIDVVCCNEEGVNVVAFLEEKGFKEIYPNSNIISFNYKGCQVDLIFVPSKYFNSSLNYLSYNDLFNLLGRLARRIGLKLGHKGLVYTFREGDNVLAEIELTQRMEEICEVLDISYGKFVIGFDSLEDIFDYVIESKYFDSHYFKLENLNHTNRVRNAKRKTYMEFMEYVKDMPESGVVLDRQEMALNFIKQFGKLSEYYSIKEKLEKSKEAKQYFNGKLVMDWFGLKDKRLGEFLAICKRVMTNDYILQNKDTIYYKTRVLYINFIYGLYDK